MPTSSPKRFAVHGFTSLAPNWYAGFAVPSSSSVSARIIPATRPVHGQAWEITHDGRGVLTGLPRPFHATRYHSLVVDEDSLPSSLLITARADGRIPMGLRHTTHQIEGIQFHPESILTTHGDKIIRNFIRAARHRTFIGG